MYVGIDQSYSGFAITFLMGADGSHKTLLKKFDPKKYGTGIERLIDIQEWLWELVKEYQEAYEMVDHICLEGYANGSKFGREQAGELGATVKRVLYLTLPDDECFPTIVPPTSLKKFVTGSGTAKKNEMLLGVYKKWKVEFTDDNEADSYALARLAQAIHETGNPRLKYEEDVIKSLRIHTEKR